MEYYDDGDVVSLNIVYTEDSIQEINDMLMDKSYYLDSASKITYSSVTETIDYVLGYMTTTDGTTLSTEDNFSEEDNRYIDKDELSKKIGKAVTKLHDDKNYKPYYWIDDEGGIYKVTLTKDRELKIRPMQSFINGDGYVEYVLTGMNSEKLHTQGHRAVALSWIGYPEDAKVKMYANHKDGKRNNNILGNIEWNTHSENITHSYRELGRKPSNQHTVKK